MTTNYNNEMLDTLRAIIKDGNYNNSCRFIRMHSELGPSLMGYALRWACHYTKIDVAEFIVKNFATIDFTPVYEWIFYKKVEILEWLLSLEEPKDPVHYFRRVLNSACLCGKHKLIKWLVNNGKIDKNDIHDNHHALLNACYNGDKETAKLIIMLEGDKYLDDEYIKITTKLNEYCDFLLPLIGDVKKDLQIAEDNRERMDYIIDGVEIDIIFNGIVIKKIPKVLLAAVVV